MTTLFIMRHGQAESGAGKADEDRRLTSEGHRALAVIATALQRHGVRPEWVVCSPLVRAMQTAEDLLHTWAPQQDPVVCPLLAPGHAPAKVIAWLEERLGSKQSLLVVGHLPDLGGLTGYALAGPGASGSYNYQPGGVARIDMPEDLRGGAGLLRWLLLPEQIMTLA